MKSDLVAFRIALAQMDVCLECLGELDTGYECNECNYDASEEVQGYGQYYQTEWI